MNTPNNDQAPRTEPGRGASNSDRDFKCYVRMMTSRAILALGWLLTLVYLSDTSTYRIRGITRTTFDIAMMLTPWGIVQNLWVSSGSWLKPFYDSPAERFGLWDDSSLRASVLIFLFLSLLGLTALFESWRYPWIWLWRNIRGKR